MDKPTNNSIDTTSRTCIAVRLRLLNRVVTNFYDDALRPLGLKISQLNILIVTAKLGLARPAQVCEILQLDASTLSRALTVIKIAKPNQDMRFDVPVIGIKTIDVMRAAGATCLALDAGKCLLLDGDGVRDAANQAQITIIAN